MEHNKNEQIVYVGLSGGVDSSVSAALLKEAGYSVVGVFIDVWQPEFLECTSGEDKRDAMRVCAALDIPFKRFDCRKEYKQRVVDYMLSEYEAGRTPNPDVMCNKHIKFGIFFERAMQDGAHYVATGHYARVRSRENDQAHDLLKGVDGNKDQSYFLWAVHPECFSRTLFPVGDMTKDVVRSEAERFGLPTAQKKDSQGVCFLGQIDMKTFLKRYIPQKEGPVINESGERIGIHDGVWFYTIGQRHGFTVTDKTPDTEPFYIIKKDAHRNTLTVSHTPERHATTRVWLREENWIPDPPASGTKVSGIFRYRQSPFPCKISYEGNRTVIDLVDPQYSLAVGQSFVLYDGDRCLGGGIIDIME